MAKRVNPLIRLKKGIKIVEKMVASILLSIVVQWSFLVFLLVDYFYLVVMFL